MCVRELIENIVDLESLQGTKVDPKMLQEILETCPINFDLPLIDEVPRPITSESDQAKILIDSVEGFNALKEEKEKYFNDQNLNSDRIKSQNDR